MTTRTDYTIEKITLDVLPGTHIQHQREAACKAALDHRCDVEFIHNDHPYLVRFDSLVKQCVEQEGTK